MHCAIIRTSEKPLIERFSPSAMNEMFYELVLLLLLSSVPPNPHEKKSDAEQKSPAGRGFARGALSLFSPRRRSAHATKPHKAGKNAPAPSTKGLHEVAQALATEDNAAQRVSPKGPRAAWSRLGFGRRKDGSKTRQGSTRKAPREERRKTPREGGRD
jgi:hypothetical protein